MSTRPSFAKLAATGVLGALLGLSASGCDGCAAGSSGASPTVAKTATPPPKPPASPPKHPGECQSFVDCGGSPCEPVVPGGYHVCRVAADHGRGCGDCDAGCYDLSAVSPQANPKEACLHDECSSDADCPPAPVPAALASVEGIPGGSTPPGPRACLPAGAFGWPVRWCAPAYCHVDADCKAKPDGYCAPLGLHPPNRYSAWQKPVWGLGCVYPGGCRADSDCIDKSRPSCRLLHATGQGECAPQWPAGG